VRRRHGTRVLVQRKSQVRGARRKHAAWGHTHTKGQGQQHRPRAVCVPRRGPPDLGRGLSYNPCTKRTARGSPGNRGDEQAPTPPLTSHGRPPGEARGGGRNMGPRTHPQPSYPTGPTPRDTPNHCAQRAVYSMPCTARHVQHAVYRFSTCKPHEHHDRSAVLGWNGLQGQERQGGAGGHHTPASPLCKQCPVKVPAIAEHQLPTQGACSSSSGKGTGMSCPVR
jgi:hypothetical protein